MNLQKKKELLLSLNRILEKLDGISKSTHSLEEMTDQEMDDYILEVSRSIRNLREYRKQVMIFDMIYDRM